MSGSKKNSESEEERKKIAQSKFTDHLAEQSRLRKNYISEQSRLRKNGTRAEQDRLRKNYLSEQSRLREKQNPIIYGSITALENQVKVENGTKCYCWGFVFY